MSNYAGMRLADAIDLYCLGTSEGAKKGWDTRGRGKAEAPASPGHRSTGTKNARNLAALRDVKRALHQVESAPTRKARLKATEAALEKMRGLHAQVKLSVKAETKYRRARAAVVKLVEHIKRHPVATALATAGELHEMFGQIFEMLSVMFSHLSTSMGPVIHQLLSEAEG